MKNKIKQIIYDMRTQPVIAWVTVIGTALSIFLIMTVVMMQQVSILSFAPESHRDRMLYGKYFHKQELENSQNNSSASLCYDVAKKLYEGLDGVEKIGYESADIEKLDAKGTTNKKITVDMRQADSGFWEVYDYTLLDGRYFNVDEVAAARRVAILTESTARRLFGGDNAVGQHFELDHNDYEVVGIVSNSSILASEAYGEVFVPIELRAVWGDGFGPLMTALLVEEGVDFDYIRQQVKGRYAELDTELKPSGYKAIYHGAPFDQEVIASGQRGSNSTPDNSTNRYLRYAIYAILLIVPAINLSSMLHSRLRRRVSEIGVRRAFGCTRARIVTDIIIENLIVTTIGGILGFALGIVFAQFYDGLYTDPTGTAARPALSLLLNWKIIGIAFGACFGLNIISAAMPAWQASRLNPVEAINAK